MTVDFETVANDKKDNDSRMSELKEKYRLLEEEIADSEDTDHLKDKELEQLLSQNEQLQQDLAKMTESEANVTKELKLMTTLNDELSHKSQETAAKLVLTESSLTDIKEQVERLSESEKMYKDKFNELQEDMIKKVGSDHENVKTNLDIHKLNEELQEQLQSKTAQSKTQEEQVQSLENDLKAQKVAYEVVLQKLSKSSATEEELKAALKEAKDLVTDSIEQVRKLELENSEMREKLESQGKEKSNTFNNTRNSIGSDGDDYGSVQEMKDHLKHARQILIQFIQKLPYS